MDAASKYWHWVRLKDGKLIHQEIASAKEFFQRQFSGLLEQADSLDNQVQRSLLEMAKESTGSISPTDRHLAECCLRCFISQQIAQTCAVLAATLGAREGAVYFTCNDLYPFVLNDEIRERAASRPSSHSSTQFQPLAIAILETFDPKKAGLSVWISRQVRLHKELSQFLQQHGVYLITDWAILNDTKPEQLQRILSEFHALTAIEIQQAHALLQGYHAVYLHDRLHLIQQGVIKAKQKCVEPTADQLTRIAESVRLKSNLYLSNESILRRLHAIATQLRQYRLYIRTGLFPTQSLDQPSQSPVAEEIQTVESDENDEKSEFLREYRRQFLHCLDQALEQVINDRVAYFQQKKQAKAQKKAEHLLLALKLFHCQGQSMGEIAPQIELEAQYQVTQLMKLKEFRAAVRCTLLQLLGDRIYNLASGYSDPERLHNLNAQIEAALDEQVTNIVIEIPEREAAPGKTNQPLPSLFSRRLCHHLDVRRSV
jgi:hypothetical protein